MKMNTLNAASEEEEGTIAPSDSIRCIFPLRFSVLSLRLPLSQRASRGSSSTTDWTKLLPQQSILLRRTKYIHPSLIDTRSQASVDDDIMSHNTRITGSSYECASSRTGSVGKGYLALSAALVAFCGFYNFQDITSRSYAAFSSAVLLTVIIQVNTNCASMSIFKDTVYNRTI